MIYLLEQEVKLRSTQPDSEYSFWLFTEWGVQKQSPGGLL